MRLKWIIDQEVARVFVPFPSLSEWKHGKGPWIISIVSTSFCKKERKKRVRRRVKMKTECIYLIANYQRYLLFHIWCPVAAVLWSLSRHRVNVASLFAYMVACLPDCPSVCMPVFSSSALPDCRSIYHFSCLSVLFYAHVLFYLFIYFCQSALLFPRLFPSVLPYLAT